MKKKRTLLGGAGIIMLATLGAKVLGALYRIPLTNMLGAEGMGVYQSVYPVYALILSVSGGAVPMAISVLVASYSAAGESARGVRLTLGALAAMLTTGAALTAALMLLNGAAARLQGTPEAETGYLAIAPSIFFVSGIAVLKGYFQGKNNMNPTALSQITEALGRRGICGSGRAGGGKHRRGTDLRRACSAVYDQGAYRTQTAAAERGETAV